MSSIDIQTSWSEKVMIPHLFHTCVQLAGFFLSLNACEVGELRMNIYILKYVQRLRCPDF